MEVRTGETFEGTVQTASSRETYFDLIFLNEFEVHCRDPFYPENVYVRYNEEYEYYANRGQYFSLRAQNSFAITRVELDLTLGYVDNAEPNKDTYLNPTCTVDGETGWTFNYRLDYQNYWCY